jgi:predicted nucleotidyltransferase
MKEILKVLTGSRAYGLANEDSDYDYRGVFIENTSSILSFACDVKVCKSMKDGNDDVSYELSKFLHLAMKSNPSILEVFEAPVEFITEEGEELRKLFKYVWSSKYVHEAYLGYSSSQRKFLNKKYDGTERIYKAASTRLRVLHQGICLLRRGTLEMNLHGDDLAYYLREIRDKRHINWDIFNALSKEYEEKLKKAYKRNPDKQVNVKKVNEFLLKIRKNNW